MKSNGFLDQIKADIDSGRMLQKSIAAKKKRKPNRVLVEAGRMIAVLEPAGAFLLEVLAQIREDIRQWQESRRKR